MYKINRFYDKAEKFQMTVHCFFPAFLFCRFLRLLRVEHAFVSFLKNVTESFVLLSRAFHVIDSTELFRYTSSFLVCYQGFVFVRASNANSSTSSQISFCADKNFVCRIAIVSAFRIPFGNDVLERVAGIYCKAKQENIGFGV